MTIKGGEKVKTLELKALEIIKKHIRYFKNPVSGPTKISFTLFEDSKDFKDLLNWIHIVEKERGWKL